MDGLPPVIGNLGMSTDCNPREKSFSLSMSKVKVKKSLIDLLWFIFGPLLCPGEHFCYELGARLEAGRKKVMEGESC